MNEIVRYEHFSDIPALSKAKKLEWSSETRITFLGDLIAVRIRTIDSRLHTYYCIDTSENRKEIAAFKPAPHA